MSFSLDISKFVAKVKLKEELVIRKICFDMFSRVIERSPVDTGRFRANWQVSIGSAATGTIDDVDPAGSQTRAKMQAALGSVKSGHRIFFVNNLPYAWPLEMGHSKQAPAGMVGITVTEFQAWVAKVVGELP